jgi:CHASE3 domain sensor protein
MKTPEDEEFERIERDQKRINEEQEKLRNDIADQRLYLHTVVQITRNQAIEEVAQEIEKFKNFGEDTISSFAIYIRNMKK